MKICALREDSIRVASRSINVLSICSGLGGTDLGVRIALPTSRVVLHIEREFYCAALLATRMEAGALDDAPIWSDLESFDGNPWRGRIHIITASLPCQPYSSAGKQRGDDDQRAIWPEFIRVVGEVRPAVIFLENVPEFLNYFRPVGTRLQEMGYTVEEPLFLTAQEVGAPHRRERLFILAHAENMGLGWRIEPSLPLRRQSNGSGIGNGSEAMALPSRGGLGELRQSSGCSGQPDGSVAPLEDAARYGERGQERSSGIGRRVRETSNTVADTESPERRRQDKRRGSVERVITGGAGGDLGNSHGSRRKATGRRDRQHAGAEPETGNGSLGNTERARSQRPGPELTERRRESIASDADRRDVPLFPPGPNDRNQWGAILAEHPDLAPAIKPGFRLLDDELALVLDKHRIDQLRAAGNGVVPLQAALAFTILARRMNQ